MGLFANNNWVTNIGSCILRPRVKILIFLALWIYCLMFFYTQRGNHVSLQHTGQSNPPYLAIEDDFFIVGGKPLRILSGSIHYFRLPAAYWRDRLRKMKAAGLNSISTYVEWSFHEPEEREYTFSGDRDIVKFIQTAAEEGLYVLLRPGPYICAERDLGGLPYWLFSKYPNIKLRTTDKDFINESRIWFKILFERLSPLLFGNGGPIILVQVENEYGSFGNDSVYKKKMCEMILDHVGRKAILYTTDVLANMINGRIHGQLATVDFGAERNAEQIFYEMRRYGYRGPFMNSEFYTGWITHWGDSSMASVSDSDIADALEEMFRLKAHINFYVFFGGTNFEFTSGANLGRMYQADVTSYDYDAPLNEAGDPTSKYFVIRRIFTKYNPEVRNTPVPHSARKGNYGYVSVAPRIGLMTSEGRKTLGKQYENFIGSKLPTFEKLRQRAGLVLYETRLKGKNSKGVLKIEKPRDRIYVYVDSQLQGVIDRMNRTTELPIVSGHNSLLSLLVENQGRINFAYFDDFKVVEKILVVPGTKWLSESRNESFRLSPSAHVETCFPPQGILSSVVYKDKVLNGTWKITGYPLQSVKLSCVQHLEQILVPGPTLYCGQFVLNKNKLLDTFLDPTGWGKGYAWINGHNLGRYWPQMGPQVSLYVPRVWLKSAPEKNLIQILELEKASVKQEVQFVDKPILIRAVK